MSRLPVAHRTNCNNTDLGFVHFDRSAIEIITGQVQAESEVWDARVSAGESPGLQELLRPLIAIRAITAGGEGGFYEESAQRRLDGTRYFHTGHSHSRFRGVRQ